MHTECIIPFLHAHPDLEELVLWCNIDEAWVDGLSSMLTSSYTFQLPNLARVWTNRCVGCNDPDPDSQLEPCTSPSAPHVEELLRRRALYQSASQPFTLFFHPDFHGPNASQLAAKYNGNVTVKNGVYHAKPGTDTTAGERNVDSPHVARRKPCPRCFVSRIGRRMLSVPNAPQAPLVRRSGSISTHEIACSRYYPLYALSSSEHTL